MMVTLTIDGKAYLFGTTVKVAELYRRAGLHPATALLYPNVDDAPALEDVNRELKFVGAGHCPHRSFVSETR
jgi:hypothetical protein